ncbi:hypothetical protein PSV09DRAFT_2378347 [Bipolaris maydis]|nr:hypothetical protein PSV09DRAFT_2378347 [Bipolaris maydis]
MWVSARRVSARLLSPASKVFKGEPAPPPARRGRPPKNTAQAPIVPLTKKKTPRGRKAAEVPVAKPTKPLAPHKIRGHTIRQIPNRYIVQADADTASKKQVQEEEANHAHDIEVKANVKDNVDEENIVPTSATIRGQGSEDAPLNAGAKSKSSHQQDSLGDQHSDGVADNLGQSEPTSN